MNPIYCLIFDGHSDTEQELQNISKGIPVGLFLVGFTKSSSDPLNTLKRVIKTGSGFLTCYYFCSFSILQQCYPCRCSAQSSLALHSV